MGDQVEISVVVFVFVDEVMYEVVIGEVKDVFVVVEGNVNGYVVDVMEVEVVEQVFEVVVFVVDYEGIG